MMVPSPTVTWRPSTHPAMMVTPSLIRDPSPITTYGPTNPPVPTMVCRPMTAVGCTPGGAGGTGYSNAIARANASRASLTRTAGLTMARRSCERSSAEAVLASASESRCASRTITSAPGTARPTSVTLVTTTSPSPTSSPPIATASSRSFMLPPCPSFESGQHRVCDIDAAESDGLLDQDHPQPPPACFIRHRGVDTFIELLLAFTRLSSLQLLDHVGGNVDPGHVADESGQDHIESAVLRDGRNLDFHLGQDAVLEPDPLLLQGRQFLPQPPGAFAETLRICALPSWHRPLGRGQGFLAVPVQPGTGS